MRFPGPTSVFSRHGDRPRAAFWAALRWRKAVVLYVVVFALGAGFLAAQLATPVYRSRVLLEVTPDPGCHFPLFGSTVSSDEASTAVLAVPLALVALLALFCFCVSQENAGANKPDA